MIYLEDILVATGGALHGPIYQRQFEHFCYDSRLLTPGELFVAVKTPKGDGHDFLEDACRRGAGAILAEIGGLIEGMGVTTILVKNTLEALQHYATYILGKYHAQVIAVSGSTGKTTTKEAIAHVLGQRFSTFKSHGNYNDLFGLPIALGGLLPAHEKVVLEMACDSHGEIRSLCTLTQPHIGVITNISPVQLQYLGSVELLAQEEQQLPACLPEEGVAVLNYDDPVVRAMAAQCKSRVLFYGCSPEAALRATAIRVTAQGLRCVVQWSADGQLIQSTLLGEHSVYTVLAATAVGLCCGLSLAEIAPALATFKAPAGRLNPLPGMRQTLLLDDSHNAAPASFQAALETLHNLPGYPKIAVVGDMNRLGYSQAEAHREVGRQVARVADYLVTKGEWAELVAQEARKSGMPQESMAVTYTIEDAVARIKEQMRPGALVLVKGSEEARMERISERLLADPAQADQVLDRQNDAWKQIEVFRSERPTWVEIDLTAIGHNTRLLCDRVGPHVKVLAVLKADAYGHGALKVARTVLHNGAKLLGVATLSEALPLRQAGITAPILVMGYIPAWQAREAVRHNLTVTLYSSEVARALSQAAQALQAQVRVHIKIDTGMSRLGVRAEAFPELVALLEEIRCLPGLVLEGIFTHFATADASDKTLAQRQLEQFKHVLAALAERKIHIPTVHAANSAAALTLPESHFTLVRPGIVLYGLAPSAEVPLPAGFKPALTFKTQVAQVKDIPAGATVSYGATYICDRPTRLAVLPVGYADGFRRSPKNWKQVLIRGQRAPLIGVVCMDQCMIDVSHIPEARQGDEVVLIGRQGQEVLPAEEVAAALGTINYEVVAEILARVPRIS